MGKTKCGVYYDLTESEFYYCKGEATFYFSSKPHLQKFTTRLPSTKNEMNTLIERKWKLHTKFDFVAALVLYLRIETRGFYITICCGKQKYNSLEEFEHDWELTYMNKEG